MLKRLFLLLLLIPSISISAPLEIGVSNNKLQEFPVAVIKFVSESAELDNIASDISRVVRNDLSGSDLFNIIKHNDTNKVPDFAALRSKGADMAITGVVKMQDSSKVRVEFRIWDVTSQKQILGKVLKAPKKGWRRTAHLISDKIYSQITGEQGYFDSQIVYVSEGGDWKYRTKRLAIMDQDGANHKYLTPADDLVMTPRFNPKRQEIVYIAYYSGYPAVYIYDLTAGKERSLGQFEGMSFAPRFSHDGQKLVMSIARDGNSDIYTMDLNSGKINRLTFDNSIDTTASFSADSSEIVFASDKTGTQKLYTMSASGGSATKISRGSGNYATPVWSPRGDLIAFTKIKGGQFMIGVMRPDGSGERILNDSFMVESPTWSPNGRMIMFTKQTQSRVGSPAVTYLYSVDVETGKVRRVSTPQEASDPAWSPLLSKR